MDKQVQQLKKEFSYHILTYSITFLGRQNQEIGQEHWSFHMPGGLANKFNIYSFMPDIISSVLTVSDFDKLEFLSFILVFDANLTDWTILLKKFFLQLFFIISFHWASALSH